MLKLQERTTFENEAEVAARMIDKLCAQYGVSVQDATKKVALDEVFEQFSRVDNAYAILLNAVATFYDAKLYLRRDRLSGNSYRIIGTEAQQIQTKLYFEFLHDCMTRECDKVHSAEKILASIRGTKLPKSFRPSFKKAFATQVSSRLKELKIQENRIHEDAEVAKAAIVKTKLKTHNISSPRGEGAVYGNISGGEVSLNRQTTGGGKTLALSGY